MSPEAPTPPKGAKLIKIKSFKSLEGVLKLQNLIKGALPILLKRSAAVNRTSVIWDYKKEKVDG